ncbi:MAG: hypothetical protein EOO40_08085 [Deltaproteobacteria bacterium]|nr:MAG: hypothetical protein EOO40_08085 [Deltaproteobacteria bacterium]
MAFPLTEHDVQMLAQAEHGLRGLSPSVAYANMKVWAWMNQVAAAADHQPLTMTHMTMLEQAMKGNQRLPEVAVQHFLLWFERALALTPH